MVYMQGELTNPSILAFENALRPLFNDLVIQNALYPLPVLLDMGQVSYIDSAGIASLVGVYMNSRHWLIELGYCGFQSMVWSSIKRTKIDQMLTVFINEVEGRRSLIERQRLYQRCDYEADGTLISNESTYAIKSLNISKGGCSLWSATPIPPSSITYSLTISGTGIEGFVNICRCIPLGNGYEIGTIFRQIDVRLGQKVIELIQQIEQGKLYAATVGLSTPTNDSIIRIKK